MKRESCYVQYNTQLCSLWTTSSLSAVFAPGLISFLFSRQFKYLHLNHPHLQSWKQWITNYRYFHQSWECFLPLMSYNILPNLMSYFLTFSTNCFLWRWVHPSKLFAEMLYKNQINGNLKKKIIFLVDFWT